MLITVDIDLVSINEIQFPDIDNSIIIDHMQLYLALNDGKYPDIVLVEHNERFFVKQGHKIFRIHLIQNHKHVDARLETSLNSQFVQQNIANSKLIIRNWKQEVRLYRASSDWSWYLLFFTEKLQDEAIINVVKSFKNFNCLNYRNVSHPEIINQEYIVYNQGEGIAVKILIKVSSEEEERIWAAEFYNLIKKIHADIKRIVSINGKRTEMFAPYLEA